MEELALIIAAGLLAPLHLGLVQVGDSYGAGLGAGDYAETVCRRSVNAPVDLAATWVGGEAANVACTGAHLSHLTRDRVFHEQIQAVELAGTLDPLEAAATALFACDPGIEAPREYSVEVESGRATVACRAHLPAQITEVGGATDVFVTVGGNDLGFVDMATKCFVFPDAQACENGMETVAESLPDLASREEETIRALREVTDARIHLVPYPPLVETDYAIDSYPAGAAIRDLQDEWNARLAEMTERLNGEVGGVSLVDTAAFFEPDMIHRGGALDEYLHPTREGHRALALAYVADLLETVPLDRP